MPLASALVVDSSGVDHRLCRAIAHGSLALHPDIVLVVVDLEDRLGRIHNLPDHDGGDII